MDTLKSACTMQCYRHVIVQCAAHLMWIRPQILHDPVHKSCCGDGLQPENSDAMDTLKSACDHAILRARNSSVCSSSGVDMSINIR